MTEIRPLRTYDDVRRHVGQPDKAAPSMAYLVCSSPRSGSTFLCECLSLTGVAGVPDEWMLESNETFARTAFPLTHRYTDPEYLSDVIDKTRTPNGVFGAKLMWPEMALLRRGAYWNFALTGNAVRHSATLPDLHYVRMVREDKLRQAVSLHLAIRTSYWHRMRRDEHTAMPYPIEMLQRELDDPSARARAVSDISAHLHVIREQEEQWERFFAAERINPFEVVYERLSEDPVGVTTDVLRFLGLTPPADLAFPRTWHLRMSDERNELLLSAYKQAV